jgi:hypothetical protein
MVLAYHKDVATELYVPIAFAFLGLVTLLLYRRLREPPRGVGNGRPNWPAAAAIVLALVAALGIAVAWLVPTEAESGVRRTIGDVGIVIAMVYQLVVGPLLGLAGVNLVRSRGHKLLAVVGFVMGYAGLAWAAGSLVACVVSDGCFH